MFECSYLDRVKYSSHSGASWGCGPGPNASVSDGWATNIVTIRWTINAVCPGSVTGAQCNDSYVANTIITSPHTGGAQFVVMDGSVHFISETVSLNDVLLRLAARNDGLTVALP
ncbi:MAG: DUF1559 domain-containing protein [Planctomycetaceae bacterium]|nr:DUF1559 domain-containing protein [Planctomycetaceae bacterium]